MIIQSKRVWVMGHFLEAQLEVEDGKIKNVLAYGAKEVDKDYGDKRIVPGLISIHMEHMALIQMMQSLKDCAIG